MRAEGEELPEMLGEFGEIEGSDRAAISEPRRPEPVDPPQGLPVWLVVPLTPFAVVGDALLTPVYAMCLGFWMLHPGC